jgi:hypothetical protein
MLITAPCESTGPVTLMILPQVHLRTLMTLLPPSSFPPIWQHACKEVTGVGARVTTLPGLAYRTRTTAYGLPTTALPVIMNGVEYTPAPMGQLHQQYAAEINASVIMRVLGLLLLFPNPSNSMHLSLVWFRLTNTV